MFLWVSSQSRPTAKQSTLPNHTYRQQNETGYRISRLFLSWHSVKHAFLDLCSAFCVISQPNYCSIFSCRTTSICPLSPQAQYVATWLVLTSGSWHLLPVFAGIQFTLILPHVLYTEAHFIAQMLDMYMDIDVYRWIYW